MRKKIAYVFFIILGCLLIPVFFIINNDYLVEKRFVSVSIMIMKSLCTKVAEGNYENFDMEIPIGIIKIPNKVYFRSGVISSNELKVYTTCERSRFTRFKNSIALDSNENCIFIDKEEILTPYTPIEICRDPEKENLIFFNLNPESIVDQRNVKRM